jgi:hypothetical protein
MLEVDSNKSDVTLLLRLLLLMPSAMIYIGQQVQVQWLQLRRFDSILITNIQCEAISPRCGTGDPTPYIIRFRWLGTTYWYVAKATSSVLHTPTVLEYK